MEQHPIPRQITTFEFKLIGFLTLKQFLYLAIFIPMGFIVYKLVPLPLVNIFAGVLTAGAGLMVALVPIQDRPIDVWVKNLVKRLTSPTQYMYHKKNSPLYFLQELYFTSDPHKVIAHIESQEKLSAYLAQTKQQQIANAKKQRIQTLLRQQMGVKPSAPPSSPTSTVASSSAPLPPSQASGLRHPFFTGIVRSNKQFPLPGILLYIKDIQGSVLRLLKTNPHGICATYSPLPPGDYQVEIKDPSENHFFDTMNIHIETQNPVPFQFYSKELL